MKTTNFFNLSGITLLAYAVSSCSVIGGILKTGIGVAIFIAVTFIVSTVVLVIRTAKGSD